MSFANGFFAPDVLALGATITLQNADVRNMRDVHNRTDVAALHAESAGDDVGLLVLLNVDFNNITNTGVSWRVLIGGGSTVAGQEGDLAQLQPPRNSSLPVTFRSENGGPPLRLEVARELGLTWLEGSETEVVDIRAVRCSRPLTCDGAHTGLRTRRVTPRPRV